MARGARREEVFLNTEEVGCKVQVQVLICVVVPPAMAKPEIGRRHAEMIGKDNTNFQIE
jgi:hypothetical protein